MALKLVRCIGHDNEQKQEEVFSLDKDAEELLQFLEPNTWSCFLGGMLNWFSYQSGTLCTLVLGIVEFVQQSWDQPWQYFD